MSAHPPKLPTSQFRPFVPAWLDGSGLTAPQFRVLAHLWRRAEKFPFQCWPAVSSIVATCRLNEDTIWQALRHLEAVGLVKRVSARGKSNRYTLIIPERPTGNGGVTRPPNPPETEGLPAPERKGYPSPSVTGNGGVHPPETEGFDPPETEGRKGITMKVKPRRNTKADRTQAAPSPAGSLFSSEVIQAMPTKPKAASTRPRNELFDALAGVEGLALVEIGKLAGGRIAAALKEIRAVCPDLTTAEIRRRAANYRAEWPTATLTANSLAAYWAKFGGAIKGAGGKPDPRLSFPPKFYPPEK